MKDVGQIIKAHAAVTKAISDGKLVPQPCEDCGVSRMCGPENGQRNYVQAHHDNYYHTLEVRWLCMKCHRKWHKNNQAVGS